MTQLMVRVSSETEAAAAAACGFDVAEFIVTDTADFERLRHVRDAFSGRLRLRLEDAGQTGPARIAAVAADEIACRIDSLDRCAGTTARRVALVSLAEGVPSVAHVRGRADAIMLEAKPGERLIDRAGIASLDQFATACKAAALPFGLAGGLEAPDVARLLLLEPDLLAFDTAVRTNHQERGELDDAALQAIRALVPRTSQRHSRPAAEISKVTDRIFVRDFEIALAIGAYQAEHGKTQRVRFSVTADVLRAPVIPHDMRDVFSYDVMIETIRVLSERAHVTFVETLAEEVAASVLAHDDVVAVEVKVEKLDVIAGSVGIEILRRRA